MQKMRETVLGCPCSQQQLSMWASRVRSLGRVPRSAPDGNICLGDPSAPVCFSEKGRPVYFLPLGEPWDPHAAGDSAR